MGTEFHNDCLLSAALVAGKGITISVWAVGRSSNPAFWLMFEELILGMVS